MTTLSVKLLSSPGFLHHADDNSTKHQHQAEQHPPDSVEGGVNSKGLSVDQQSGR